MSLSISCGNPPQGEVGKPYSYTVPVSGGTPAYTFSIVPAAGVVVKTANYTAQLSDSGVLIVFNSSSNLTLTLPSSPPNAFWNIFVENIGTGTLTISPNGLDLDGSSSSLSILTNHGVIVKTDGTNYFTERGRMPLATTSVPGLVAPDGTIITVSSGAITVPKASSSVFGVVEVDGTTITASGGVISSTGGGTSNTGASINNTSQSSIANGTNTQLTFSNIVRDDGGFTGVTANALVVPTGKAGWYVISAGCQWPSSGGGLKGINILVNGSLVFERSQNSNTTGSDTTKNSQVWYLAAADTITVTVFQSSGGPLTMGTATLAMTRVN